MGGFIKFIKKQHFWLIVPVLVIVMAVSCLVVLVRPDAEMPAYEISCKHE